MRVLGTLTLSFALLLLTPASSGQSFTFLQPGFTQELYGFSTTTPNIFGGVAFAPNGDVWVDLCLSSRSPLVRFSTAATTTVNNTTVHSPVAGSPFASNAGCGLTNHPDGTLYSNTTLGVVNLDADTGAQLRNPYGSPGNGLGIAVDPQTGDLVYVAPTGAISFVDAAFTASGVFSSATIGSAFDGIFFDPSGNFLFMAKRFPSFQLTVIDRAGTLVQDIPMTSEPDGIAFHINPTFVVSSNTDGTMTRFDFPANDFTVTPMQSVFASNGFRGDLSQVGADGCLYLTQNGTRFSNGVISSDNSIVRICPNFVAPPGVNPAPGRMTGGGSAFTNSGTRVTHGVELHCNTNSKPNNLQVNWGPGKSFHLEALTAVVCFTDTSIDVVPPRSGFNTLIGRGSGRYNGLTGATVQFTLTDAGEPGKKDSVNLVIIDIDNNTLLSVSSTLQNGNHHAHAR